MMPRPTSGMKGSIAFAFAGLLGLAACSSWGGPPVEGSAVGEAPFELSARPVSTTAVDLPKSYRFAPEVIEVSEGSSVTWTNNDNFIHSVKLADASGTLKNLPIGSSATITFDRAGILYYVCSYHPSQMRGKVIVNA